MLLLFGTKDEIAGSENGQFEETWRFLRHDVVRTFVPDRESDLGALRAGQVHDAFPRANHRLDVRDRNGRDRSEVGATK
jgi:hypothetical protein